MKLSDPRNIQISLQSLLIGYLSINLNRELIYQSALICILSSCIAFFLLSRLFKLEKLDFRSSMISGLSIAIMLQASSQWYLIAACFLAVASKFLLRSGGRHFFNPSNFAISCLLLIKAPCWLSLGTWNQAHFFLLIISIFAVILLAKVQRLDLFLSYSLCYGALVLSRNLFLENPWHIFTHHFFQGSHFIFALLMLTDPVATPHNLWGRVFFSCTIASLAFYGLHILFITDAAIYALFIGSALTPLINKYLKGKPYQWRKENLHIKPASLSA